MTLPGPTTAEYNKVVAIIKRRLWGSQTVAKDLAQDLVNQAYLRIIEYYGVDEINRKIISNWVGVLTLTALRLVATNHNTFARRSRIRERIFTNNTEELVPERCTPESLFYIKQTGGELLAIVNEVLPEKTRKVINHVLAEGRLEPAGNTAKARKRNKAEQKARRGSADSIAAMAQELGINADTFKSLRQYGLRRIKEEWERRHGNAW